ncbi:MAG: branched-chain amino acid ABC transporter permease [Candidatus Thioglobus sp.]|uniref:branched-chain amino acid ABC transporter permease n=1 Tax=Candidatus Thioglobus sp. TaxID=2026721 RepID=UPI0030A50926
MELLKKRSDLFIMTVFSIAVFSMPIWLEPLGASYPDLLQKFAIFGIFAIGYNILFGLTGYLSFGHAIFIGVGSYTAVWSFKLLSMNAIPAIIFGTLFAGLIAFLVGYVSLRRSGIYFSILTLAFAQMFYNLAYSVLSPITNGETGLTIAADDPRVLDRLFSDVAAGGGLPSTEVFGISMSGYSGFYFTAVLLILAFFISLKIFNSPFGLKLKAIKSNQHRMKYTGYNTRPYLITAFVISGMFAGLAGSLMAVTDPLAGAERMQWTASGEVVLMTILGGVGTLYGPLLGVGIIKYLENIFSAINESVLQSFFAFMPQWLNDTMVVIITPFVGEGWHLTLGLMFMVVVIFLPGGVTEGFQKIKNRFTKNKEPEKLKQGDE